ncbi:MAG: hypothetical protein OXN89_27440 [Bryobacterales bacterium]|nr:hypothetical protein [Bryobacterales bacterium]
MSDTLNHRPHPVDEGADWLDRGSGFCGGVRHPELLVPRKAAIAALRAVETGPFQCQLAQRAHECLAAPPGVARRLPATAEADSVGTVGAVAVEGRLDGPGSQLQGHAADIGLESFEVELVGSPGCDEPR